MPALWPRLGSPFVFSLISRINPTCIPILAVSSRSFHLSPSLSLPEKREESRPRKRNDESFLTLLRMLLIFTACSCHLVIVPCRIKCVFMPVQRQRWFSCSLVIDDWLFVRDRWEDRRVRKKIEGGDVSVRFVWQPGPEETNFRRNYSYTAIDATSRPNLHRYIASNFIDITEYKIVEFRSWNGEESSKTSI